MTAVGHSRRFRNVRDMSDERAISDTSVCCGVAESRQPCSLSHFAMKLFFAAPLSALPSDPTALGAHASRLHFAMKLFFAAPASGLPSFPTALLSHVPGNPCAAAEPIANADSNTASMNRFILSSPFRAARLYFSALNSRALRNCTAAQPWLSPCRLPQRNQCARRQIRTLRDDRPSRSGLCRASGPSASSASCHRQTVIRLTFSRRAASAWLIPLCSKCAACRRRISSFWRISLNVRFSSDYAIHRGRATVIDCSRP